MCVPLNIVLYNVFSGGSKGPNIYGVEPWHYYLRNLALNFNAWFFLALGALPLLMLQHLLGRKPAMKETFTRGMVFLMPFYLWLGIFTLQPHKEERFMYPAYPALAFNAALSAHLLLVNFGSADPRDLASKIPSKLKLAIVSMFAVGAVTLGALRTIGLMTAYSAPLTVYAPLQTYANAGDNVCIGKEWYRFPSSYHLPDQVRAKFIKSEFSGLLPGEFSEANIGSQLFPGTWLMPSGMNDENREDPGKYVSSTRLVFKPRLLTYLQTGVDRCTFLIDSYFDDSPSPLEPNYVADADNWEKLYCSAFLDSSRTSFLGRLFWVPEWPIIPERHRRKWGQYCLLRRKNQRSKSAQ